MSVFRIYTLKTTQYTDLELPTKKKQPKLPMFSSVVVPDGWKVAVVDHGHVWIAETKLENSRVLFRFSLVLTDAEGHLTDSMQELTLDQAFGEWKDIPGWFLFRFPCIALML